MRGVYEVFIVDPEAGKVVVWGPEVAASDENAKMKAITAFAAVFEGKDIDDFDFGVVRLCGIRAKKEIQTVKVIKE